MGVRPARFGFLPFFPEVVLCSIAARFARKGEAVVDLNRRAFAAGRAAAAQEAVAA